MPTKQRISAFFLGGVLCGGCASPAPAAAPVRTHDIDAALATTDDAGPDASPVDATDEDRESPDDPKADARVFWIGDSARLLIGKDKTLHVVDAETGRLVRSWKATKRAILEIQSSPTGRYVVTRPVPRDPGSPDAHGERTGVAVWDTQSGALVDLGGLTVLPPGADNPLFEFSDGDRYVAGVAPPGATTSTFPYVWDLQKRAPRPPQSYEVILAAHGGSFIERHVADGPWQAFAWSKEGAADAGYLFNRDSGQTYGPMRDKRCPAWDNLHLNASRKLLVQPSVRSICFWDVETRKVRRVIGYESPSDPSQDSNEHMGLVGIGDWPWLALIGGHERFRSQDLELLNLDTGAIRRASKPIKTDFAEILDRVVFSSASQGAAVFTTVKWPQYTLFLRRDRTLGLGGQWHGTGTKYVLTSPATDQRHTPELRNYTLWDRATGRPIRHLPKGNDETHYFVGGKFFHWLQDEKFFFTDNVARVGEFATGRVQSPPLLSGEYVVGFDASQKFVATSFGRIFDTATLSLRYALN